MGDFANGAMEGDGLWKNEKGEKYVGKWKDNRAHGQGIHTTENSYYQGQFVFIQDLLPSLSSMDMALNFSQMETSTEDSINKENLMEKESINGKMVLNTLEILKQD